MSSLRDLKNPSRFGVDMAMALSTIQRMLGASLIVALGVWYLQGQMMDAMLTLVALCALTGLVWILSERELTFASLQLSGRGPLNMLAIVGSIIIFAELSIVIWAFPTVGAYILSLSFIGSFWLTGYMLQPNGA